MILTRSFIIRELSLGCLPKISLRSFYRILYLMTKLWNKVGERVEPQSNVVLTLILLAPISCSLTVILILLLLNLVLLPLFCLGWAQLRAVTTAWDVHLWPGWCSNVRPWISSNLEVRDNQSYCCWPSVLPTSECSLDKKFSGTNPAAALKSNPKPLLFWAELPTGQYFWPTASLSIKVGTPYLEMIKHISCCKQ